MNTFGLGLILNFTDNATSGLRGATNAFNELSNSVGAFSSANSAETALLQISAAAGIVGNELSRVGGEITSLFTNVVSSITSTGSAIASARTQLSTLYGDAESGQAVLDQIKDYAASSVFNFEDLIPSVIMLKANGIEAFDQIATSAYIASNGVEGTSKTLMDYAAALAAFNPNMVNMYGTGVQAAMGALNEYIAEGNAASLKRGASLDILQLLGEDKGKTIEERSRQVADLIEQLGMISITDNMANTASQRLSNVEDILFNLKTLISDAGVFEKYTKLVAKFTDYIFAIPDEELAQIAQIVSDALVELLEPAEKLIDFLITIVDKVRELVRENPELTKMIIKGIAISGIIMTITGAALKLLSAIGMLKFSLGMLFRGGALAAGGGLLSLFKNLALYVLPVISAVILLKEAWDRNFMGMQEKLKSFVTETIDTFKILFDAWGDYTLSEENFVKAREMGILPLVEAVLQLKYHLGFLVQGFKKGFDAFFDSLGKVLTRMGILDEETHGFRDLVTKLLEKITAPGLTDNWEKIGYLMGKFVGWLMLGLALLPIFTKILKLILGVVRVIVAVGKGIGKIIAFIQAIIGFVSDLIFYIQYGWYIFTSSIIPAIGSFFSNLFFYIKYAIWYVLDAIGSVVIAILGAIGIVVTLPAWVVGLIVAAIAAVLALVWHFRDEIAAFLVEAGIKIGNFFKGVLEKVKNALQTVWDWFKSTKIGSAIIHVVQSIGNLISNVARFVYEVVRIVVYGIIALFQNIWEGIQNVLSAIADFFRHTWDFVSDLMVSAVETIQEAVDWLKTNIFEPIGNFIGGIFDAIADKIHWLKENVVEPVFGAVKDFICGAIQAVSDFVMPILDAIADTIGTVIDGVANAIDTVSGFVGSAADWVGEKADNVRRMVGLSTGGYVKTTGIAVLHPNEVVVNDTLTKNLAGFLNDYENTKTTSTPLVKQDIVATDDYTEQKDDSPVIPSVGNSTNNYSYSTNTNNTENSTNTYNYSTTNTTNNTENGSPMQNFVTNSTVTNEDSTTNNNGSDNTEIDNSVVFESGSIIFKVDKNTDLANMTEEELNGVAEKLMRIMARKMQLRNMQTRK